MKQRKVLGGPQLADGTDAFRKDSITHDISSATSLDVARLDFAFPKVIRSFFTDHAIDLVEGLRVRLAAMVLAGGRGSRMGGEIAKPLLKLGGRTLLERVLDAIPAEAWPVVLNANERTDREDGGAFARYGLPIVPDARAGFAGPLAGLEAVTLSATIREAGATHLLVLPGDTPFLSTQALRPLLATAGPVVRVARHAGRLHPTVAIWPLPALAGLSAFLDAPGRHAVLGYLDRTGFEAVEIGGDDPFFNVNTPADLATAEIRLASG